MGKNEFRLKEKSSLFISQAFHVESADTANKILKETKRNFFDASHNCYAYKLSDGIIKYSDDGEMNGTAGIRILNAINHENLFNLIVIVTRYFGGTKLGVGLLGKTYYNSAIQVLKFTKRYQQQLYLRAAMYFDFEHSKIVHRMISKYAVKTEKTEFTESTKIFCLIPSADIEKFISEITAHSHSKVKISVSNTHVYL
ncbi:MAG: YigZ family protein [Bacteroidota bacterium]